MADVERIGVPVALSADPESLAEVEMLMVQFARQYQGIKFDRPVRENNVLVTTVRSLGREMTELARAGLSPLGITLGVGGAAIAATMIGVYRKSKEYSQHTTELFYRSKELGFEIDKMRGVMAAAEMTGVRGEAAMASLEQFADKADDIRRQIGTLGLELRGMGEAPLVDAIMASADNSEAFDAMVSDVVGHLEKGQRDRAEYILETLTGNSRLIGLTLGDIVYWAKKFGKPGPRAFEATRRYLDVIHQMEEAFQRLKQEVGVAVMPGVAQALRTLTKLWSDNPQAFDKMRSDLHDAGEAIKKIASQDLIKSGRGFALLIKGTIKALYPLMKVLEFAIEHHDSIPSVGIRPLSPKSGVSLGGFPLMPLWLQVPWKFYTVEVPNIWRSLSPAQDTAESGLGVLTKEALRLKKLLVDLASLNQPRTDGAGVGAPVPGTPGSAGRGAGYGTPGGFRGKPAGPQQVQPDVGGGYTLKGAASWYQPGVGWKGGGGQTASGEMYDPNAYTAAIQMGYRGVAGGVRYGKNYQEQWADVTDPATGKTLRVKINDVMPYNKGGRIIDLNRAAAEYFDSVGKGVIPDVTVKLLPPAPPGTYSGGPVAKSEQQAEPIRFPSLVAPDIGGLPKMPITPNARVGATFDALTDRPEDEPKVDIKVSVNGPGLQVKTNTQGNAIDRVVTQRDPRGSGPKAEPVPYLDQSRYATSDARAE